MTRLDPLPEVMSVVYRPILPARRGELLALQHLNPAHAPRILPILQLRPTPKGPLHNPCDFFTHLRERAPYGLHVGVDLGDLPDVESAPRSPSYDLAQVLGQRGVPMLPVIRLFDSARRLVEHGTVARMHLGQAIVRFRPDEDPVRPAAAISAVRRVLRHARLVPEQCDLMIDMAQVGCAADVRSAQQRVLHTLAWARTHPWRSLAVAAGAMPSSLSDLPTNQASRVRRWDSLLWRRVAELGVGYGDYGISPPVPRPSGPRRPLPTMRYTTRDAW